MTLYELKGEYLTLMDMAEDESIDTETLADTLEGVEGEIEDKADGYAKIIKSLEGDVESIKKELDRLTAKKTALENKISTLKGNLQDAMIETDHKKIKTDLFTFTVQKNAPSLDLLDEGTVPQEFWVEQPPKLDRRAALSFVKEHGDQSWGQVRQTESLRIR